MLLEADRAELARPLSIDGLFDAPKTLLHIQLPSMLRAFYSIGGKMPCIHLSIASPQRHRTTAPNGITTAKKMKVYTNGSKLNRNPTPIPTRQRGTRS